MTKDFKREEAGPLKEKASGLYPMVKR